MPTRMTKTEAGVLALYHGGYVPSPQYGSGFMDNLKKAHDWVKNNKVISKVGAAADALGATGYLDRKTGGRYSQGMALAKSKGYGKRTRRSGSKKATRGGSRRTSRKK